MATESSEVYGEAIPETLPDLWHRLCESVKKHPDELALVCTHQPPDLFSIPSIPLKADEYQQKPYLRWTYTSLKHGTDRLTRSLKAKGVKAGTPVVNLLQNNAEYVLTFWAANQLGCVIASVNPRNLQNKEEVTHILKTVSLATDDQPIVLVAGNSDLAQQVDSLSGINAGIKIVISDKPLSGWISFQDLMGEILADDSLEPPEVPSELIFFTSGTTSLPKGIRWTPEIATACVEIGTHHTTFEGSRYCIALPNNHVFGTACLINVHNAGGAVLFPGPAFAPDQMMSTLYLEKCTHTALVPTMLHSLLGVKATNAQNLEWLKLVRLGGSVVTPELLRQCIEDLGSQSVEVAYGMTEGVSIFSGGQSDLSEIIKNDVVMVGRVPKGGALKICAPGESTPLARGVAGELHFSGRTLCSGYIGKDSSDFYTDAQGKPWIRTGDQLVMDHNGSLYVVGRYKDMIIRGGENIAPAAIETVLSKVPRLGELQIQTVGAPDSIAGEVPVAVVNGSLDSDLAQEIQDTIIKQMGTGYTPDEVISLQQLGLEDYPKTMAGKIQKTKLAELVRKYRSDRDKATANGFDQDLEDLVRGIWARAIGREPHQLPLDAQISEFGDSIVVMRVRDKIKRATGKSISLAEMAEASTLAAQIKLLRAQPSEAKAPEPPKRLESQGPPGVEDMAHLIEDPELFDVTKEVIGKAIAPYGLEWNDVVHVTPAYDYGNFMSRTGLFNSWNFQVALVPDKKLSVTEMRTALEMTLKNNTLLASFLVWDEEALESDVALHLTVKHERKFLDQVVQDGGTLEKLEELSVLTSNYPEPKHASFPGPLFRAIIYYVQEIEGSALLYNINHAIADASYALIFADDLDSALAGATEFRPHLDYKVWSDSYHALRTSPAAKAATKWHVKRLKDLDAHVKSIYPPAHERIKWNPLIEEERGLQHTFQAPGITHLRSKHGIAAAVALKSALALLNVHRTGQTHALFCNLEAARATFPFVPKSLESQFEATDVAGQTIQQVINLIPIPASSGETVIQFLQRIQADQRELTKHASAPLKEIIAGLGPKSGALVRTIFEQQIFNWIPGTDHTRTTNSYGHRVLKRTQMPGTSFTMNAGFGGDQRMFLNVSSSLLDIEDTKRMAYDVERILMWLLEEGNWEKEVVVWGECLKGTTE